MPDEQSWIVDWANLPPGISGVSLWAGLHDAQIIAIQSNLLHRTVTLNLEIEHLRIFYELPLEIQFLFRLEGVQSARVLKYSVWPGAFTIPSGVSKEEEARLVAAYQAKWREESLSWSDLERAVTAEHKQVIDISDATLATGADRSVALRIMGLFNYTSYHELVLRAERLTIFRSDAGELAASDLVKLGETYWDAVERQKDEDSVDGPGGEA
jgi:hypothetical protein